MRDPIKTATTAYRSCTQVVYESVICVTEFNVAEHLSRNVYRALKNDLEDDEDGLSDVIQGL